MAREVVDTVAEADGEPLESFPEGDGRVVAAANATDIGACLPFLEQLLGQSRRALIQEAVRGLATR